MKNLRLAALAILTTLTLAACGDAPPPADAPADQTVAPPADPATPPSP